MAAERAERERIAQALRERPDDDDLDDDLGGDLDDSIDDDGLIDFDEEPLQINFPEGPYWDMLDVDLVKDDIDIATESGQNLYFWSQDLDGQPVYIGADEVSMRIYVSELYDEATEESKRDQVYAYYRWKYVEVGEQSHFVLIRTDLVNGKTGYIAKEKT